MNWKDGTPFMFDKTILEWYWGMNSPDSAFVNSDEQAVTGHLALFVSKLDNLEFYRQTEARCHTDTWYIWNERFISAMILGGWGKHVRNIADQTVSVAWPEGGGENLARWVTYADSASFFCRMYSFDLLPGDVTIRLFRIKPGIYEITLAEDSNGTPGKKIYTTGRRLRRFEEFSFTVPPSKPVILTVHQIKRVKDPGPLPDLAVAGYDCERDGNLLRVRVSNLGAAPSKQTTVSVYDASNKKIGEKEISLIEAPTDFVEKSRWLEFNVLSEGLLKIVVDPENSMEELYKGNNLAIVE